jgi:hypothetical protein
MKICGKCKKELDDSCFNKRSGRVNQLCSYCKDCMKQFHNDRKERRKLFDVKPTSEEYKIRYHENREKIIEQRKKRYEENKEKYHLLNKKWRATESAKQYKRKYGREKYKNDINERVRLNLRSRVKKALKSDDAKKNNKLYDLLGCSILELKRHLESLFIEGMSWDNYGKWHIDHIIPCASFDLTIIDNQKKCFHYTNLQPLWAFDNLSKGCKILI